MTQARDNVEPVNTSRRGFVGRLLAAPLALVAVRRGAGAAPSLPPEAVGEGPKGYVQLRRSSIRTEWTMEALERIQRRKNAELHDLTEIVHEAWREIEPDVRRELEKPSPMLELFPG